MIHSAYAWVGQGFRSTVQEREEIEIGINNGGIRPLGKQASRGRRDDDWARMVNHLDPKIGFTGRWYTGRFGAVVEIRSDRQDAASAAIALWD